MKQALVAASAPIVPSESTAATAANDRIFFLM
jgi:hypothetical protein